MVHFTGMLKKVGVPLQLPEQLDDLRKGVDGLIDGFILEMQQLKTAHANYIDQHLDNQLGTAALRRRLTSREALERTEATGNGFFRLNQEATRMGKITSPYSMVFEELSLKIEAIRTEMASIKEKIR